MVCVCNRFVSIQCVSLSCAHCSRQRLRIHHDPDLEKSLTEDEHMNEEKGNKPFCILIVCFHSAVMPRPWYGRAQPQGDVRSSTDCRLHSAVHLQQGLLSIWKQSPFLLQARFHRTQVEWETTQMHPWESFSFLRTKHDSLAVISLSSCFIRRLIFQNCSVTFSLVAVWLCFCYCISTWGMGEQIGLCCLWHKVQQPMTKATKMKATKFQLNANDLLWVFNSVSLICSNSFIPVDDAQL